MRLSNKYKAPYVSFIYTFLQIILALSIVVFFVEIQKFKILGDYSWFLIGIPILIIWLIYILGRPIFEYDSDGEVLIFRNKHMIPLLGKELKDEFPKYKFVKHSIINIFFIKGYLFMFRVKKDKR